MKIYIEVLMIFILMIIFILWRLWFTFSRWKLRRAYKPENDKARKGGEELRAVERTKPDTPTASESIIRLEQPERRKLLQTTDVNSIGENCSSSRKLLRRRTRRS